MPPASSCSSYRSERYQREHPVVHRAYCIFWHHWMSRRKASILHGCWMRFHRGLKHFYSWDSWSWFVTWWEELWLSIWNWRNGGPQIPRCPVRASFATVFLIPKWTWSGCHADNTKVCLLQKRIENFFVVLQSILGFKISMSVACICSKRAGSQSSWMETIELFYRQSRLLSNWQMP